MRAVKGELQHPGKLWQGEPAKVNCPVHLPKSFRLAGLSTSERAVMRSGLPWTRSSFRDHMTCSRVIGDAAFQCAVSPAAATEQLPELWRLRASGVLRDSISDFHA